MSYETHFELFARKTSASDWALELATEERAKAFETAEEFMKSGRAVAVRVTREVLDTTTGQYRSAVIFNRGLEIKIRKAPVLEDRGPMHEIA